MKVYLAGDLHSNWQQKVIERASSHQYFNPQCDTNQNASYFWTTQEINSIKGSDMLFAYYGNDNPSGLGLALEIGVAVALNIPVIFIDEHDELNAFLCASSKKIFHNLDSAIKYLSEM